MTNTDILAIVVVLAFGYLVLQVARAIGYKRMVDAGHAPVAGMAGHYAQVFWGVVLWAAAAIALVVWG